MRERSRRTGMAPRESEWVRCEAEETADVLVTAMALGGVNHLFFTSGSDILFFQEAVTKAQAKQRPTPDLITTMHETIAMNAALGYSMVSGRPAATAVHVDVGTLNYGCALHTAGVGGYPVLAISGSPATAYPGTMKGARDHPIYWIQEMQDQRQIAQAYSKWRWRLELQDNPGLIVSRALQIALAQPQGPSFMTVPREVGMAPVAEGRFPSLSQLGVIRPSGPDPEAIDELAGWLLDAERPVVITGKNGRNPESVAELVRVVELTGASVTDNGFRDRLNFPTTHPALETGPPVSEADVVVVVDRRVPWVPVGDRPVNGGELPDDPVELGLGDTARAPMAGCKIAWLADDAGVGEIPILELEADLRISTDPRLGLRALREALEDRITGSDRERAAGRLAAARLRKEQLTKNYEAAAEGAKDRRPIDPRWLAYQLGRAVDSEAVFLDESLINSAFVRRYCQTDRPNSFFAQGGSGGGWGSGAAIGAKLAEPERDVVLASGDGFYAFGIPAAALWTAAHHSTAYLAVVFVNAGYSTGTRQVLDFYPDGYTKDAGYPGGAFDPPPDFGAEARAAGAHGETVTDPHELEVALARGLDAVRNGQPAVVGVRIS